MAKASISIEFIGYGERTNIVYISIRNTGDVSLTGVELWVDGVKFSTLGTLDSGSGLEKRIFLNRGEHLLEVKTSEGVHDALNITVPSLSEMKKTRIEEKEFFLEKYRIPTLLFLFFIFSLSFYFLLKKPSWRYE